MKTVAAVYTVTHRNGDPYGGAQRWIDATVSASIVGADSIQPANEWGPHMWIYAEAIADAHWIVHSDDELVPLWFVFYDEPGGTELARFFVDVVTEPRWEIRR